MHDRQAIGDGRRSSLTVTNGTTPVTTSYAYDPASRLTAMGYSAGVNQLGNLTFGYDADGRIVSKGGSFASVNLPSAEGPNSYYNTNQLQSWNGITGTAPDAANNLRYDPATNSQYTWDARNQLAMLNYAEPLNFLYDALGRIEAVYPYAGVEYDYQFDGFIEINNNVLTMPGSGEVLTYSYQYGGSTSTVVPLHDQIGSAIGLVDASGNLAAQFTYEPFGKATASGQSAGYPYLFAGMEQADSATGLYRTPARYYNPHLQRFLSEDPLGFTAGDTNFFSYAGNNPINGSDPSGDCALGDCAGGGSSDQEGPAPTTGDDFIVEWVDFLVGLFDGGGGGHPYIRGQGFKAHTININTGIPSDQAVTQHRIYLVGVYETDDSPDPEPTLHNVISPLACLEMLFEGRKISNASIPCHQELGKCDQINDPLSSFQCQENFIEKYQGGNDFGKALYNCACEKAGGSVCNNFWSHALGCGLAYPSPVKP